jgi:hypothetical protein
VRATSTAAVGAPLVIDRVLKQLRLPILFGLIPAAVILGVGNARAVLVYEFIQQGSDVRVDVSGSLTGLPSGTPNSLDSTFAGQIIPSVPGMIHFGPIASANAYSASGPTTFGTGGSSTMSTYSASTGIYLEAISSRFFLSSGYVPGTAITGSGLLTGKTLSTLGLSSTSGLLGTWTIGSDSIELWAGPKGGSSAAAAAPGPLPLLGAGAAFAYSRRLRSRLRGGRPSLKA